MAAAGHSPASDSSESVPAVQVYWTPNLGCRIRVSPATGAPDGAYMKSASWVTRRALRTVGDGGVVIYPQAGNRIFPRDAPVASMKLKPEGVPRHLGQQDVTAYFPRGETAALVFDRFFDWDFDISVGAIQGHSRVPGEVAEEALGKRLTAERCRNYMFYAKLDYESFLNHGHQLYLTSNGIVLSYADFAPMYLTFHYRPSHEKDPGGLRYEKKQHEAGVGSSHEEGTSASASASATGSSPQGEVPADASALHVKKMPKRLRTSDQAADSSTPKGGSPQGEVPTLDKESLQKLIRENELEEEKKRQSAATESEGSTRYAYQQGDTVRGKVDATKAQQQEELNEILRRWRLFKFGLLRRIDDAGMRMETPYGDPLVRITPFHSLPSNLKKLLGDEFTWASWLQHRFQDTACTSSSRRSSSASSLGRAFPHGRDVYREIQYVRDDFALLTSVVAETYGPNFISYITRNSTDHEMRKKYRIISEEGYPLYDSTLREPYNASYILACLESTLQSTEGQGKDFKSSFARKAKSDLIAYERLREKREAELEELYARPFEDIAVEEFLD
eukprot:s2490_g4.t2